MSTVARSFFDSTRHRIGPALVFGAAGLAALASRAGPPESERPRLKATNRGQHLG
jgi:hypothetical protein